MRHHLGLVKNKKEVGKKSQGSEEWKLRARGVGRSLPLPPSAATQTISRLPSSN